MEEGHAMTIREEEIARLLEHCARYGRREEREWPGEDADPVLASIYRENMRKDRQALRLRAKELLGVDNLNL